MSEKRKSLLAFGIGMAVLLAGGAGFRILAGRLARLGAAEPLPPAGLGAMPLVVGQWSGRDVPLADALAEATDTDALLSRAYTSPAGRVVTLYIGYGIRARDLMPHRPEVCYPGAGWTLQARRTVKLELRDGSVLPCTIYRFFKGGFDQGTVLVLDYYVVDGRYCPDVSLLRSKAWRGQGAVHYVAQVQVTARAVSESAVEDAERAVRDFAEESARHIVSLFPEVE